MPSAVPFPDPRTGWSLLRKPGSNSRRLPVGRAPRDNRGAEAGDVLDTLAEGGRGDRAQLPTGRQRLGADDIEGGAEDEVAETIETLVGPMSRALLPGLDMAGRMAVFYESVTVSPDGIILSGQIEAGRLVTAGQMARDVVPLTGSLLDQVRLLARALAGLEPQTAPKAVQAETVAMARPPRVLPRNL